MNLIIATSALCVLLVMTVAATETTTVGSDGVNNIIKPLKVSVFYETLCPDSLRFMRQLYERMWTDGWLVHTDLKFIPYGKVMSWTNPLTNITNLFCQHGEAECELNAMHACIVENNDIDDQLNVISCLMRSYNTDLNTCATQLDIDVSAAQRCKATRSTVDILQKYRLQTDALDIDSVPTVVIDDKFDRSQQWQMTHNFGSMFCKRYKEKFNETLNKC